MVTAATRSAGAFLKLVRGGNSAEFKCPAHVLIHFRLDMMHRFLRVNKTFGHRVAEKGCALGVEGGDFGGRQFLSLRLLVLQTAAFFAQAFVLLLRLGVRHDP